MMNNSPLIKTEKDPEDGRLSPSASIYDAAVPIQWRQVDSSPLEWDSHPNGGQDGATGQRSSEVMDAGVTHWHTVKCLNSGPTSTGGGNITTGMPEHLQALMERSGDNLSSDEKEIVASLLCEYSDVFSKNDLDFRLFYWCDT